jgi:YVTN family beta-propeller protein
VSIDPSTHEVLVANVVDNTVSIIKGAGQAVTGTLGVGNGPDAIAVDPDTHMVYVANSVDNTISVVNGLTNEVMGTLDVGNGPDAIGVDPTTHMLYVANSADNTVSFDQIAAPVAPLSSSVPEMPGSTITSLAPAVG